MKKKNAEDDEEEDAEDDEEEDPEDDEEEDLENDEEEDPEDDEEEDPENDEEEDEGDGDDNKTVFLDNLFNVPGPVTDDYKHQDAAYLQQQRYTELFRNAPEGLQNLLAIVRHQPLDLSSGSSQNFFLL